MGRILRVLGILISVFLFSGAVSSQEETLRKPAFAGKFYPEEEATLSQEIEKYLANVPDLKVQGELTALIVPHAGYIYSGPVAAYAYKLLKDTPRKVVILIGPSHYFRYNYISIFSRGVYESPLGKVVVNEKLAEKFTNASEKIKFNRLADFSEHSLEVQIPFLQRIWGNDFTIVPILLGDCDWDIVETLKRVILDNLPEESFILIASSDMSHYYRYEEAVAMDKESLRLVKNFATQELYKKIKTRQCEWCGGGAVLTVMEVAKELGANKVKVLKYANSGDTAPPWLRNKDQVVGYSSLAFYKEEKEEKGEKIEKEEEKLLNKEEQKKLLEIARLSIENTLQGEKIPEFLEVDEKLKNLGGTFVTLNKQGRLRGCIGFPEAVLPLYQAVSQSAISAALKDYRFPPVSLEELPDIEIEISVLSPLEKITDINKIEVGKHGLVIRKGIFSGLLLPQVATEYGWDRAEFLERICEKAGLPQGAWRSNAEIYIFTAQVFHEGKE